MNHQIHMKYWSAQLWPRLFPIINHGDKFDVMEVFNYLKQFPEDDRIVQLLNTECIKKLKNYGIDHNFVY